METFTLCKTVLISFFFLLWNIGAVSRKEKSLGMMSRKFLMLFLISKVLLIGPFCPFVK